ncbi:dual specificity protein phosphatase family protein [Candidatus Daviesbacteria bacterium]|nr:dual specificity protein phosphatase family protein [Candidatus Daviesbacteria bacterium]
MPNKIIDLYNHTFGHHHKSFDYNQITDEVFIGTNMCCQFGFNRELLTKKVRADISLEEVRVDAPMGVDYFLWLPTKDHQAPTFDKLTLGVQTLDFLKDKKIKVYIHCKNGHGRAPTLLAAYFIYASRERSSSRFISQGMEVEEAIEKIRSKRPEIHIRDVQIEALNKFKQKIGR